MVALGAGVAVGVAYAAIPDGNKVFTACMLKNVGTVRLIDKSLPSTNLMSHCTDKEIEISWNQKGQDGAPGAPGATGPAGPAGPAGKDGTNGTDGKDGISVSSAVEPAGTNCANGGSKFTAANGVTYACNGSDGSSSGPSACSRSVSGASGTEGGTVDVAGCTSVGLTGNSSVVCALDGGVEGQPLTLYADHAWSQIGGRYVFVNALTYAGQPFTCNGVHNLRLNGSYLTGVEIGANGAIGVGGNQGGSDTLQLVFDGENWLEVSQMMNVH